MSTEAGGKRRKLGLALSGGGFRASLFHIGVFRRLAELDLLRDLSIISAVSGGSIVAAHYLQLLLPRLERSHSLTMDEYVALVRDELEPHFREGVARNLRTRLFWNPLQNLRMLVTRHTMGERMAALYQRHLYAGAVPESRRRSGLALRELQLSGVSDIETHNADPAHDTVPKLLINATTLNTGRNFRFTAAEIGDPVLGYIRYDEAWQVLLHKRLLRAARKGANPAAMMAIRNADPESAEGAALRAGNPADPVTRPTSEWTLRWYRYALGEAAAPEATAGLRQLLVVNEQARSRLVNAEFELLRNAKLRAWYLNVGGLRTLPALGGTATADHHAMFWSAIADIDKGLAQDLQPFQASPVELFNIILDLYLLRSADAFAWTVAEALGKLRVPEAVAASANFPPVFAPYVFYDLYDSNTARRLALTDGGVFDNQGITALLEEGCTRIIASDAGGGLDCDKSPALNRAGMLVRMSEVFMNEVRSLQVAALRENVRVTNAKTGPAASAALATRYFVERSAFFHAGSHPDDAIPQPPGLPPYVKDEQVIGKLRTDLDGFSGLEMDALIHQGYRLADRFVRTYGLVSGVPPLPASPVPLPLDEERTTAVLAVGANRMMRALRIIDCDVRGTAALLLIGLLAPLLVFGVWAIEGPLLDTVAAFGGFLLRGLLWPVSPPLAVHASTRTAVGVVLGIAAIWLLWARVETELSRLLKPRNAARIGLWRNQVWWLFYLSPLALALLASAAALVSHALFTFIVSPLSGSENGGNAKINALVKSKGTPAMAASATERTITSSSTAEGGVALL